MPIVKTISIYYLTLAFAVFMSPLVLLTSSQSSPLWQECRFWNRLHRSLSWTSLESSMNPYCFHWLSSAMPARHPLSWRYESAYSAWIMFSTSCVLSYHRPFDWPFTYLFVFTWLISTPLPNVNSNSIPSGNLVLSFQSDSNTLILKFWCKLILIPFYCHHYNFPIKLSGYLLYIVIYFAQCSTLFF